MATSAMGSCLLIVAVLENRKKIRSSIELARLTEISIMDNKFKHEWVVEGIWFVLEGEYHPDKIANTESEEAVYEIEGRSVDNELVKGGVLGLTYSSK